MNYPERPVDLEAEHEILSTVMADPDAMSLVFGKVQPEDFYYGSHQTIYSACEYLFAMGEPVDIVRVSEVLQMDNLLDYSGGRSYINEVVASYCISDRLEYFAKRLKEVSLQWALIDYGTQLAFEAHSVKGLEMLSRAQDGLLKVLQSYEGNKERRLQAILDEAEDAIVRPDRSEVLGASTGFPLLDEKVGGLRPSSLNILAGRPAMGKSAFALNLGLNVANQTDSAVVFYTLEMSDVEFADRLLKLQSESIADVVRIGEAKQHLAAKKIEIIDRPVLSAPQIRASLIRVKNQYDKIGLVVIDYLQLMQGEGENQAQKIAGISRDLKLLAKEFKVPVVCLSQLNRGVEARQDKRPMMSDLRDSGAIEQDADVVMLMYRDAYYYPEKKNQYTEIIVAKNRHGKTGTAQLVFRGEVSKFYNAKQVVEVPRYAD